MIEWNSKLMYMQDALDELLKVQKTWLYLEPIFASPDILRQMPTEGRRFQKVDAMYRNIMETASQASQVLQVMGIESLKENLIEVSPVTTQLSYGHGCLDLNAPNLSPPPHLTPLASGSGCRQLSCGAPVP